MFNKVFLDANIFLDANDDEREIFLQSSSVLSFLVENKFPVYTSYDLITTIYYILSKKSNDHALESIDKINTFCKIINFANSDVEQTCQLMRKDKDYKDLEDTLQYVLAKKDACDLIVSNDKNFYSKDIPLLTSEQFVNQYIKK